MSVLASGGGTPIDHPVAKALGAFGGLYYGTAATVHVVRVIVRCVRRDGVALRRELHDIDEEFKLRR